MTSSPSSASESEQNSGSRGAPKPRGARQGSLGTSRRGVRSAGRHGRTGRQGREAHPDRHVQIPSVEEAPVVSVSIATTGIHPTTARIVAMSLVFFSGEFDYDDSALTVGEEVLSLTRRFDPDEDIGPQHIHGYIPDDLLEAKGFHSSAEMLRRALDGRTVIVHQAGMTWGFIAQEFRRAQRIAARHRRNRTRGRAPRKVETPQPLHIIDTLGSARRQSIDSVDPRLRAIAEQYHIQGHPSVAGLEGAMMLEVGAAASEKRNTIPADDLLEADAHLIAHLAHVQVLSSDESDGIAVLDPSNLMPDQFGIQRSHQRVQAARASRRWVNPGVWTPGEALVQGMEFVISPDIATNPDELIEKATAAGLAYSEKLNRRSSLVVCNENFELRGKSMHAERKNIPLMRDSEFLELLEDVQPGEREPKPVRPGVGVRPRTSSLSHRGMRPTQRSGQGDRGQSGRGQGGRRQGGRGQGGRSQGGRSQGSRAQGNRTRATTAKKKPDMRRNRTHGRNNRT
ncbi:DNA polymerase III subunit epsilon [Corynebacterium sp. zg254]|uniref:DNA polymerase III subunit epsilon n=1 Tax=Corynebacterium zhongnanshanii TaxID=2768834 RepID=A0ABQ6VCD5_9CORY|nr:MULTISPECIES: BRCT domain-containing protein [Corynebacterium]KAB3519128.1 DNA polymerase III subunit epsilon [Corynebacterium zhongnanshanii]MCR5914966.1 DNA polymerase III subunit epsilon [Corynebacterium sp. zg254]